MQFTAPMSIDETAQMLLSHKRVNQMFADTMVEIDSDEISTSHNEFSVRRRWKGRSTWFSYPVIELKGTLTSAGNRQTTVNINVHLSESAYLIGALVPILLVIGLTGDNVRICLIVAPLIALEFAFDGSALYRVIQSLRTGKRS